jgi:hypothetical protein
LGQVEELVGHVVGTDFVYLDQFLIDGLVVVEVFGI